MAIGGLVTVCMRQNNGISARILGGHTSLQTIIGHAVAEPENATGRSGQNVYALLDRGKINQRKIGSCVTITCVQAASMVLGCLLKRIGVHVVFDEAIRAQRAVNRLRKPQPRAASGDAAQAMSAKVRSITQQ